MTIKELIKTGKITTDHWLAKAIVTDEDVDINQNGSVIWKTGIWEYGVWQNGTWKNGIWKSGKWKDGVWKNGIWENGIWENGTWIGGTWKGGNSVAIRCKWKVFIDIINYKIRIGCYTKTPEQWDDFFASDKVLETPRNTDEFKQIQNAYQVAKLSLELNSNSNDITNSRRSETATNTLKRGTRVMVQKNNKTYTGVIIDKSEDGFSHYNIRWDSTYEITREYGPDLTII